MRKLTLAILCCAFTAGTVMAQDEEPTNKNGKPLLPDAGDFGVGVNLVPMFNWMGNMFNGNNNNTYAGQNKFVNFFNNTSIFGKYMLTENSAIRATFGFNFNNFQNSNYVIDDNANHPDSLVMDHVTVKNHNFTFAVGYEMRRGGRLQGIFGGDLLLMTGRANDLDYTYGNAFGSTNIAPTTTTWNGVGNYVTEGPQAERMVYQEGAKTFGIGLRPYVGMEYYVAPKLSLGLEFGWNIMYNQTSETNARMERYETSSGNTITLDNKVAGNRRWSANTDNLNGAIFMMFYF